MGKALELVKAAGATATFRTNWPPVLAHIHSTLRVGSRPSDSVLDEYAEARAVSRLFVADNSALPNGIGGPNPTLTSQALATRTAENIFVHYFGGHRWVKHESPVVSTDRRVTHGLHKLGL